ncbi:four helix bundle protein [Cytobacillus horneckiae]|uniref:four helix bundle protein n=1 Tax=Cytobacillus horneckiae TaxID=549687 RepID=UPI002DBB70EA|nr:four helix bundle protein [Cytobacillus horneckiae]MEC1157820.1 four helix bundle protein [Cytobacillus horneckiae]MED2940714.1 four helix bundle protein [Cytobacillus horneckiae]
MSVKKQYIGNFRDLIVYRKSQLFRKDVYAIIKIMPTSERFIMKKELYKASSSLCANLAEGNGSFYYGREYEHFDIALCKLAKCKALLDLSFVQGYITEQQNNRLQDNAKEISRMINALMKRIERYLTNKVEPYNDCSDKESKLSNLEATIWRVKLLQKSITNMVNALPNYEADNVVDQVSRAVSSVYANLTKSKGVISDKRVQELSYANGSISEVRSFLDIVVMENYITMEEYRSLDEDAGIIHSALIEQMEQINIRLKEI